MLTSTKVKEPKANSGFLPPPPHPEELPLERIDPEYKRLRLQVFLGIFLGYAGNLGRKNISLVMPRLALRGYSKTNLGFALSGMAIAFRLSIFLMGNVSAWSNARSFLSLGLWLSALTNPVHRPYLAKRKNPFKSAKEYNSQPIIINRI